MPTSRLLVRDEGLERGWDRVAAGAATAGSSLDARATHQRIAVLVRVEGDWNTCRTDFVFSLGEGRGHAG